jgi:hypothetical protein
MRCPILLSSSALSSLNRAGSKPQTLAFAGVNERGYACCQEIGVDLDQRGLIRK